MAKELTTQEEVLEGKELDKAIALLMRQAGIPSHVLGYDYLHTAIKLCYEDKKRVHSITKILYPMLAKKFESTPNRVERAMRHAIEIAFKRENIFLTENFSYDYLQGKSTNSEFIADAVVYLRNNY